MEARARKVASQKIRDLGDAPDTYSIQVEEDAKSWRVMFFTRKRRVRGGGYEITVDKQTYQVKRVRRYQ